MVFFFSATAPRPALGPTERPIQCIPWILTPGTKRPVCESDHLPLSSAEVKNASSYTSTLPIRLRGMVLRAMNTSSRRRSYLSTETTLSLLLPLLPTYLLPCTSTSFPFYPYITILPSYQTTHISLSLKKLYQDYSLQSFE
jgi:hypothetical protein